MPVLAPTQDGPGTARVGCFKGCGELCSCKAAVVNSVYPSPTVSFQKAEELGLGLGSAQRPAQSWCSVMPPWVMMQIRRARASWTSEGNRPTLLSEDKDGARWPLGVAHFVQRPSKGFLRKSVSSSPDPCKLSIAIVPTLQIRRLRSPEAR